MSFNRLVKLRKAFENIVEPTLPDASVIYVPQYLYPIIANSALISLKHEVAFQPGSIKLFGKPIAIPPLQAWHGDANLTYKYSNVTLVTQPWTTTLAKIKEQLNEDLGKDFNGVLCNLYRTGQDRKPEGI